MAGIWTVEELDPLQHYCGGISCGTPALDKFLRQSAAAEANEGLNKTFVLFDEEEELVDNKKIVVGYYTASPGAIARDKIEIKNPRRYPDIGVIHLGRIAVDMNYQDQGLGTKLMLHMMRGALHASEAIGGCGINLMAEEKICDWYTSFGFETIESMEDGSKQHLYISLQKVRDIVNNPEIS